MKVVLSTLTGAVATNPLQVTVEGIVIALVFISSIGGVLGWMLRVPRDGERKHAAARVVRSVNKQTRILVPILRSSEVTDRIVVIASQMAHYREGIVDLLAVIEVPFTLPLDAHVEQDKRRALEDLERAEALALHGGPKSNARVRKRILKARQAGVAIVHDAEEQAADLILLANETVHAHRGSQNIDAVVEYVMKNAPCEVMVFSPNRSRAEIAFENTEQSDATSGVVT
ncbi:hypothetical protein EPA93_22915 [Ktedonosporobacter rubrisoli]|uniref:UspA domain-containing protein n=1 Tax=Ktedonosporobacter rubrisoli TaxID=2509675 RepID=A0A4P6JTN4_KTERU|nr:universal stress protein [Ktedonosporobacter rubrisoli]QBD78683.1 hypothetical protein EPA93_22915 [Ktedonosporobacter rubrisoli]